MNTILTDPTIEIYEAQVLAAKDVLIRITNHGLALPLLVESEGARILEEALLVVEKRCWGEVGDDLWSKHSPQFRDYCSLAFDIRRVLPLGQTEDERVKGAVYLASLGVLGGRGADVRRYLEENPWPVPKVDPKKTPWPKVILFRVADGVLRTVRNDLGDLDAVGEAIAWLRRKQVRFEAKCLRQPYEARRTTVIELIALYHLAKAIETLAVCIANGPCAAPDEVESQLSRSLRAACFGGLFDLATLLRWISMAAAELLRAASAARNGESAPDGTKGRKGQQHA